MGSEPSNLPQPLNNEQCISNNVDVIDQCIHQAQYNEKQLIKIYETNEIPEDHHKLYTTFHNAYRHHLQHSKHYIQTKLISSSCCRFSSPNIDANQVSISDISLKEWTHIATYHRPFYKALQTSQRRSGRYIRLDVISRQIQKEKNIKNTHTSDDSKSQARTSLSQSKGFCADVDQCDDYKSFCKTYKDINLQKEPQLPIKACNHCILYHVEDFPPSCKCEKWDENSTAMQHIAHGHWFHRHALDKLAKEKKENQQRKSSTPHIKYQKHDHKYSSHVQTNTTVSLRNVLEAVPMSKDYQELQFGAAYDAKTIEPQFRNPKEEMLYNKYKALKKTEWNDLLRKCVLFIKAYEAKVSGLTIKEIVALKLYTDFDQLQNHFRQCFRGSELKRKRQFYWWNKLLVEACNKSRDTITHKIYHGINSELTLSTFSGTYYGPVSTTTKYDVARAFSGKSGKILELYPSFGRKGLKLGWLSNFPDEEEILYMNTSFQIANIYETAIETPTRMVMGGLNTNDINVAYNFEEAVMKAIQSINVDSKVISLNDNNKFVDLEDDAIGNDDSGFVQLEEKTQLAVLYLLYLQYRKNEWNDFLHKTDKFVRNAFQRFRNEFVLLAENVVAVKMERLSKLMQIFFYTKQRDYIFPISVYDSASKTIQKSIEKNDYRKDQPFRIETIIRLFPNAQQISINAKNWDFSLNNFIQFLQKFDMNYADIKLQDIYIKYTKKTYEKNMPQLSRYEIVTDNPKAQQEMNKTPNPRKQLNMLRYLGWQFVNASHLHRVGFEPTPELPFVMVFVKPRKDTRFYYQSYSMQFTSQQIKSIGSVKERQPGQCGEDDDDDKEGKEVDEMMEEGDKYVVVHHNPANCILSAAMWGTLDYKEQLIALFNYRKQNYTMDYKAFLNKNPQKCKFFELCLKVETLVLDPMPSELKKIFMEYPNNLYHRGIISFETIYKMFPNVKELFLRNTVLNLRMCYHLVKFEQQYGDKSFLKRIFFFKSKDDEGLLKDTHIFRFKLVLGPHSWDITKSECMLQKDNLNNL